MKKIIYLVLTVLIVACSSDDSDNGGSEQVACPIYLASNGEFELMHKKFEEKMKLEEWAREKANPRAEGVFDSVTFTNKEIWYKEVKEDYPNLVEEYLDDEDFDYEGSGNSAMMSLLIKKNIFLFLKDNKGNDYFESISGNYNVNGEDREDGLEDWTITRKNIEIEEEEEVKALKKRSRKISQKVKDLVWNRDGGKCVECGSNENLEFDHIIPHSKGGANTYRNIQLLCEPCNRSKSAKIG